MPINFPAEDAALAKDSKVRFRVTSTKYVPPKIRVDYKINGRIHSAEGTRDEGVAIPAGSVVINFNLDI